MGFLSGGVISIIVGAIALTLPIIGFIGFKIYQAYKAREAYKTSQDKEIKDSQNAQKDILDKDKQAHDMADAVDDWAKNKEV